MKKCLLILVIVLVYVSKAFGQEKVQIITTVTGPREIAAQLDNIDLLMSRTLVRIKNLTNQPLTIAVEGSLSAPDMIARTVRNSFHESQYITLGPNATEILTGERIRGTFSVNNVEFFLPSENRIVPLEYFYSYREGSGRIPEGSYEFCFQAYEVNPNMNRPNFSQQINMQSGNCVSLYARVYDPPLLQSVNDATGVIASSSEIQATQNADGSLRMQWQAPAGLQAGTLVSYQVLIAEMLPNDTRDPNQVIQAIDIPSEPLAFYRENITHAGRVVTHVIMPVGFASPLELGRTYAVQITASSIDPLQPLPIQNNGRSPIYSFVLGGRSLGGAIQLASYPANDTYMPFRGMPIIVKYGPYSDTYRRFESSFNISNSLGGRSSYNRQLPWNPTPLEAQRRATGDNTLDEARAQHIAISQSANESGYNYYNYIARGQEYEWSADVRIQDAGRNQQQTIAGRFKAGMDKPILMAPAHQSIQDTGLIKFDFKTANEPVLQTLSPFDIVQRSRTSGSGSFDISIHETGVLEVARKESFDSIIYHHKIVLDHTFLSSHITNETLSWQNVLDEVYKVENAEMVVRDTGTYYWRIRWLTDPDAVWSSPSYNQSEIWKFVVKADTVGSSESSLARNSNCSDPCEMTYEYTGGRPTALDLAVGEQISIGQFTMQITEISSRSGAENKRFSGKGVITNFGFIIDRVLVDFTNIQVANSTEGKRVYEGLVKASQGGNLASNIFHLAGSSSVGPEGLLSIGSNPSSLAVPFGWDQNIDGHKIIGMIDSIYFGPTIARAKFRVGYEMPGEFSGHPVEFAAEICIGPGGFKEDFDVYLDRDLVMGDVQDDQYTVVLKGRNRVASGEASSGMDEITKLSWNCEGFKSLKIALEVQFARENIIPENEASGVADSTGRVSGFMNLLLERQVTESDEQWGFIGSISFPQSFQFTFLPGWGFKVQDAVFDFSDSKNDANMNFPAGYDVSLLGSSEGSSDDRLRNTWIGFYLKRIQVSVPKALTDKDETEARTTFMINDILIDRTGFTGFIQGHNIASASEKGWRISLDTLGIGVVQTRSISGHLAGSLGAPFFEEESRLNYSSLLAVGVSGKIEYNFKVNVPADRPLKMKMWQVNMQLKSTSFLKFSLSTARSNAARFEGRFDGSIGLDSSRIDNVPGLSLSGIGFENFAFDSDDPNFFKFSRANRTEVGGQMVFAFASPQHTAGNFPLNIRDISISMDSEGGYILPKLGFVTELSLSDIGFKASLGMDVVGEMQLSPFNFRIRGVDVKEINIDCNFNGFELSGGLGFYNNDPTYGKGVYGHIAATLPMGISGKLTARFGTVGEAINPSSFYDYWYVDGMIKINPGITIFSGFAIYGFGGGAYYNMTMNTPPVANAAQSIQSATLSTSAGEAQPSGSNYTPNKNSFGLMATVLLGTQPNADVFNMDVTLHAQFNTNTNGLEFLRFVGNGYVMTNMTERNGQPPVRANVEIGYYNTGGEEFVRGTFDVYLNVFDVIKGAGSGDRFVNAEIYADLNGTNDNQWWFYMGKDRPLDARGGILINIPGLNLQATSYIMVGHGIPADLPPLPDDIRAVLDANSDNKLNNQLTEGNITRTRSGGTMLNGQGFAFGAHFKSEFELNFLMFYAKMGLALGFDVNISKNLSRVCAESGIVPGVNGWYAQGQAYAALTGEMGIKVDLFFIKGEFKIIDLKAVIAMQAKLPNPNYFQGRAALTYDILQGMIKGRCDFNIEIGTKCTPVSTDPLQGLQFISDMNTSDNGSPASVFSDINTAFNFAMGQVLELEESSSGETVIRRFMPYIHKYELKGPDGSKVTGTSWRLLENGYIARMTHQEAFLSQSDYHVMVEVRSRELFANGSQMDTRINGEVANEQRELNFTTGDRPRDLMEENVLITYPIQGQRNYLQDEIRNNTKVPTPNKGFVKIKQQDYLFETASESASNNLTIPKFITKYWVSFVPQNGGSPSESPLSYDASSDLISFDMPRLDNTTVYHVKLIKRSLPNPAFASLSSQTVSNHGQLMRSIREVRMESVRVAELGSDGNQVISDYQNQVEIGNNRLQASESESRNYDFLLYQFNFRTSRYNNFAEKMNGVHLESADYSFGIKTTRATIVEQFDMAEAPSSANREQLVMVKQAVNTSGFMDFNNPQTQLLNNFYRSYNEARVATISNVTLPQLPIGTATSYKRIIVHPNSSVTMALGGRDRQANIVSRLNDRVAVMPNQTLNITGNFTPLLSKISTTATSTSTNNTLIQQLAPNTGFNIPGRVGVNPSMTVLSAFTLYDTFDWKALTEVNSMKSKLLTYARNASFMVDNITNSTTALPMYFMSLTPEKQQELYNLGGFVYPLPQSGYQYKVDFIYQVPTPQGGWTETSVQSKMYRIK